MDAQTARWIFALLCALGMVVILFGLWLETSRMRRGASVISPRHFRWRAFSGVLWCLVLVSFAYATLFVWPQNKTDVVTAKRFFALISGATCLMGLAFLLLFYDLWQTARERRLSQRRFEENVNEVARRELEARGESPKTP